MDPDELSEADGARDNEGAGVDEAQLEGALEAVAAEGDDEPPGVREAPQ